MAVDFPTVVSGDLHQEVVVAHVSVVESPGPGHAQLLGHIGLPAMVGAVDSTSVLGSFWTNRQPLKNIQVENSRIARMKITKITGDFRSIKQVLPIRIRVLS